MSNIHHYLSEIRLVILFSIRFFLQRNEIRGAEDQVGDWVFCVFVVFFYSVYTLYEPEQFAQDSHEVSPFNYLLGMLEGNHETNVFFFCL